MMDCVPVVCFRVKENTPSPIGHRSLSADRIRSEGRDGSVQITGESSRFRCGPKNQKPRYEKDQRGRTP